MMMCFESSDRDRDVVRCLLAKRGVSHCFELARVETANNQQIGNKGVKSTYDLARVLRRLRLRRRTRFFLLHIEVSSGCSGKFSMLTISLSSSKTVCCR